MKPLTPWSQHEVTSSRAVNSQQHREILDILGREYIKEQTQFEKRATSTIPLFLWCRSEWCVAL